MTGSHSVDSSHTSITKWVDCGERDTDSTTNKRGLKPPNKMVTTPGIWRHHHRCRAHL